MVPPPGVSVDPDAARLIGSVAWALVHEGELVDVGAEGVTKAGGDVPVTVNSRFHIGSNTKAMTALLAGIAVDRGEIEWDSTIGEVLDGNGYDVPSAYASITLRRLLSHTGGVPSRMPEEQWRSPIPTGKHLSGRGCLSLYGWTAQVLVHPPPLS